ncbi:MAG: tetratricopeptide repeat protein [Saprospiraceae bacterium]|nr:tetratricopeptide repeat protein [Candidatus Brachybacter algidus]
MRSQIACLFLFFLVLSSCNKTLKVKTGEDAYDVGQYSLAAELLESEWNNSRQNEVKSDKAFLLGQSYDKMNEPEKALSWYKQSTQDSESPSKLIYLAYALKNTGRYAEAITVFQQLGKQLNDVNRFRNELVTLNNVNQWQSDRE